MYTDFSIKSIFAPFFCLIFILTLCACGVDSAPPPAHSPAADENVVFRPEASPEPSPNEEVPVVYSVRLPETPAYGDAEAQDEPILYLQTGQELQYIDEQGRYIKLKSEDGAVLWVHGWYLTACDPQLEARRNEELNNTLCSSESFTPIEPAVYTCTASNLNCRDEPNLICTVLCLIPRGTQVTVLGMDGEFCLCRLNDGSLVYCSQLYLTDGVLYASVDGAVDLRQYLPEAEYELLFASENNIAGYPLYPAVPLLESTTAEKLKDAFEIFHNDGYIVKIYDAYRPKSAQYILFDILPDVRYLANPYTGDSWHQRGRAVDMSLIDMQTGIELEMPTAMHGFMPDASRHNSDSWSEAARENVDYMTSVMQSVGFSIIDTEWWHFEYLGAGGYMNPELDLNSIDYVPHTLK